MTAGRGLSQQIFEPRNLHNFQPRRSLPLTLFRFSFSTSWRYSPLALLAGGLHTNSLAFRVMSFSPAHFLCAVLLVCTFCFVPSNGALLSNYSAATTEWVVSPAAQKQWWGRWPGACGAVKCNDPPVAGNWAGLRFLMTMYGDLKWDNLPGTGTHQINDRNCSVALESAMAQRFASYEFSCGQAGFTPDATNGPCPDMQLRMLDAYPADICQVVVLDGPDLATSPIKISTRHCKINNTKVDCTDGILCNDDYNLRKPIHFQSGEYEDYVADMSIKNTCQGSNPDAMGEMGRDLGDGACYSSGSGSVNERCGAAYLSFGKYEMAEAGNPPCDKDGNVEPGKGPGKNTGRCALPCVTYRAFDERYWVDDEQTFCPCLNTQKLWPSVLRENSSAPARSSKFRYFLYHTEFALGFDAAGTSCPRNASKPASALLY